MTTPNNIQATTGESFSVLPPMEELKCDLCGCDEWRAVYVGMDHNGRRPMRIARCTQCGLMSQNPRRTIGVATEHYRQLDNAASMDEGAAQRKSAFELELARLESMTSGRRMLEVGCASGNFLCVARDRGWDVWGVEPTQACVEFARSRYGLRVHAGVLAAVDFGEARFDIITMSYVLEHIPDPSAVIGDAIRLLAPDGILYLTVPNCGSLEVRLRLRLGAFSGSPEADAGHMHFFSRETIGGIIAKRGGKVIRVRDGIGGGLVVRRFPNALAFAPKMTLAGLDLLDTGTSLARLGTNLRVWAKFDQADSTR